jgi:hypothetical protein
MFVGGHIHEEGQKVNVWFVLLFALHGASMSFVFY